MNEQLQLILDYKEYCIYQEQNKQQTLDIYKSIKDQIMMDNQEQSDLVLKTQYSKLKKQYYDYEVSKEEFLFKLIKINQCFIQYLEMMPQRNQVSFKFQYKEKYQINSIKFFEYLQNQLQKDENQIKVFIDKGHLNFSFNIYVNQNSKIEYIKQLIKYKTEIIFDSIKIYEKQKAIYLINNQGSKYNNSIKKNIVQPQSLQNSIRLIQNYNLRLLELLKVISCVPKTKTIIIQIIGQNKLYKVQYKNQIDIDKNSLLLIQNGELQNLEKKINGLLNSFDINIQKIISNLFFKIYLECQLKSYYQFFEFQMLSEYFNRQLHILESFEIRIQLLIQILCAYLLKIQLNLDSGFPQKDVILIDSQKQIKLDMLAYLKYTSYKTDQLEQSEEMQQILNYFEFLFPNREKQIIIDNYNITNELEDMKQIIKQNKINLNFLIFQLIHIEKLIKQQVRF